MARPCATRAASSVTKNAAVEPVPSPSTMPLSTKSRARSAAARFRRSRSSISQRLARAAPKRADLRQNRRQKTLPAKARVDRHHEHDAAKVEDFFDLRQRGRRVQHGPRHLAEIADLR